VTFTFEDVTKLTELVYYGYYAGGSGHQISIELYNYGTTAWDNIGTIGSEASKRWYAFPIFNSTAYMNTGEVIVHFRHIQSGVITHDLILDYLELAYGGSGGSSNVSAASVSFTPYGDIAATNVGGALIELDAEKVAVNTAITGATKTKITYDAKGLVTAGTDMDGTEIVLTDVTTNDVSTTKHGFAPKGTNVGKFLKDDGTWSDLPSLATQVTDTLLTGTVNGSNTVFTTASNFTAIQIYKNGQALHLGDDFTVTGANQVTFVTAPATGTKLTYTAISSTNAMIQGSNSWKPQEVPTGLVNSSNTSYTTSVGYIANTLEVYINGVRQQNGVHFTETTPSSGTFTMSDAPTTGDNIIVSYQFVSSVSGNADTLDGYHAVDIAPIGSMIDYAGVVAPSSNWMLAYGQAIARATYSTLFGLLCPSLGNVTMTIAAPGVVTSTAHGLLTGDAIYFTTTGALPTGLTANTIYYVSTVTTDTFTVATTRANAYAGTKITTSGSQSGVHSLSACPYGLGDGSTTFNLPDARGVVIAGGDKMGGTPANKMNKYTSDGMYGNPGEIGGSQSNTLTTTQIPAHNHSIKGSIAAGNFSEGVAFGNDQTPDFTSVVPVNYTGGGGAHNNLQPTLVMNKIIKVS